MLLGTFYLGFLTGVLYLWTGTRPHWKLFVPFFYSLLAGTNRARKAACGARCVDGACGAPGHFSELRTFLFRNHTYMLQFWTYVVILINWDMLRNEANNVYLRIGMRLKSLVWGWKYGKMRDYFTNITLRTLQLTFSYSEYRFWNDLN